MMAIRREPFSVNEYYHIYSRGTDKREIFLDDNDRKRFLKLLFICNSDKPVSYRETANLPLTKIDRGKTLVSIGAYCLMPNHFHILVKETEENGIVQFMRKLLTGYSSYFNKKYERTGILFSSRFKSSHTDTDRYLKYMFSYIHLNPLKLVNKNWREKRVKSASVKDYLAKYHYSSYKEYAENISRAESLIIDKASFPKYFKNIADFEKETYGWLLTEDGPR